MSKRFNSNGKLLLTAEYVILDGALGLALPTTYGQSMTVKEIKKPQIIWKSLDEKGTIWFEAVFELSELERFSEKSGFAPTSNNNREIADTLLKVFLEAKKLNSKFLGIQKGYEVETQLGFPRKWGLGSSSTLINNMAQWAKVDAYELLRKTFSGSGYDIASAKHNKPIVYQLLNTNPYVKEVTFTPPFTNQLYFVHLNNKQNSRDGIAQYQKMEFSKEDTVSQISEITSEIISCKSLSDFESLLTEHEKLIAGILKIPTVKSSLFPDYDGAIKSLGAWGGDFILATGNHKTPDYFKKKGYETVIPYSEMVL